MFLDKLFKKKMETQIVRFEGAEDDLVWLAPYKQIPAKSSLDVVVTEDYQAECTVDGVRNRYSGGRFNLSAGNNTADVEIVYVRKESVISLKWGTPNPIDIQDPIFEMPIRLGSSGEAKVSICDTQVFRKKLVSGARTYTTDDLADFCRSQIAAQLSSSLSIILKENGLSYFDISAQLIALSYLVKNKIESFFNDYGLKLEYFIMTTARMWDEGALERLTADREFNRRYREREEIADKLRSERKQDERDSLDGQLAILRALGNCQAVINESNRESLSININSPAQNSKPNKSQCRFCGAPLEGYAEFCPICGNKVKNSEVSKNAR